MKDNPIDYHYKIYSSESDHSYCQGQNSEREGNVPDWQVMHSCIHWKHWFPAVEVSDPLSGGKLLFFLWDRITGVCFKWNFMSTSNAASLHFLDDILIHWEEREESFLAGWFLPGSFACLSQCVSLCSVVLDVLLLDGAWLLTCQHCFQAPCSSLPCCRSGGVCLGWLVGRTSAAALTSHLSCCCE